MLHTRGFRLFRAFLIVGCGISASCAPALATSIAFVNALGCRRAFSDASRSADKRQSYLLNCADRLQKCELRVEIEGDNPHFDYSACRANAIDNCTRRLVSTDSGSLSYYAWKYDDQVIHYCGSYTQVMSTGAGGLWFANSPSCGTAPDLATLLACLRGDLASQVDAQVARTMPRAGMLFENAGLGPNFPNLPWPAASTHAITATPGGDGGALDQLGTITPAADEALKFVGSDSLPCGPLGNDGTVTVTIGPGISCPINPVASPAHQQFILQEPYGADQFGIFGPFIGPQIYCIERNDGTCMDHISGSIDAPASPDPPPSTGSVALRRCYKRLADKVRMFTIKTMKYIHNCADTAVRCKLASEIDGTDPAHCLVDAAGMCAHNAENVAYYLNTSKQGVMVDRWCGQVPFTDLKPLVQGPGFSYSAAGCSTATTLSELLDCVFGIPGATGTFGAKCAAEREVFIRDPRANDSLTAAGLNPAADFPCLGPTPTPIVPTPTITGTPTPTSTTLETPPLTSTPTVPTPIFTGTPTATSMTPTVTPTASVASERTAVVIAGISAASISAGEYHTCAVTNEGQAACWGRNLDGESTVPPSLGEVTQVSAGDLYTCAVTSAGTVTCWGYAGLGKATPPEGLTSVKQVATGGNHTCALRVDGTVVCWGDNRYGQASPPAGLSDVAEVGVGTWFSCARRTPGDVVCWGSDSFMTTEVPNDLGPVVQISVRYFHTCARRADGSLRCWGALISVPPDLPPAQQVSAGINRDCVLAVAGQVICWSDDSYPPELAPPVDLGAVDQVSAGGDHTCARRVNGEVVCWGYPFDFPPSPTPTLPPPLTATASPTPTS